MAAVFAFVVATVVALLICGAGLNTWLAVDIRRSRTTHRATVWAAEATQRIYPPAVDP